MNAKAASLVLERIYQHEQSHPHKVFLTQPVGNGQVIDYTWGQTLDQSRRMAAHLKGLGHPPGTRIALDGRALPVLFISGQLDAPFPEDLIQRGAGSVSLRRVQPKASAKPVKQSETTN